MCGPLKSRPTNSGLSLVAYGRVNMPLGAVVEGEIVDAEAVATSIRELWKRSGIKGRDVAIGVSNQKVVVRLIDLPFMERAELEGAIQYQAQDYIPIPIEDAILDFHILGDYMTPADEHMMEVLLVAAQRDMIGAAVAAVEGAGLKLAQIDLTAFALVRGLFGDVAQVLPDDVSEPGEATGVIHVSSGLTNIAVVERDVPRFTRVSSVAGNQFTQAIANVLNITFGEAEELKIRVGLPGVDGTPTAPTEGIDRLHRAGGAGGTPARGEQVHRRGASLVRLLPDASHASAYHPEDLHDRRRSRPSEPREPPRAWSASPSAARRPAGTGRPGLLGGRRGRHG